jgi:hypothetical protein
MTNRPVKKDFSDFICRPFCVFFKEGQKEDMACGGALAVARLIAAGLLSTEDIPQPAGSRISPENDRLLFELVCRSCPFVLDGCDYRLPTPPDDAVACGGLILLGRLFDSRIISADALRNTDYEQER